MKSKHLVSIAQHCGSLLPVLYLVRAKILSLIPHNEFNFASELHCSFHTVLFQVLPSLDMLQLQHISSFVT